MSITIKEIAEMAGVSRGTVDRVIHSRPGVSQKNIDKVNKIINEYGFKPNSLAKALATKQKSKKIGVILNCIGNCFFDDVLDGIAAAEKELSYYGTTIIQNKLKGYSAYEQIEAINNMMEEAVDGLIISPLNDSSVIKKIEELNVPVVTCNMDADIKNKIDYVGCNYTTSGKIAASALVMHAFGKKINVGIVHGSKNIKGHIERYEAFKNVASQCENINIIDYFYTEDNSTTAYEKTNEMINNNDIDFIYVVASGIDGVMQAIDEADKKIYAITNDVLPVTVEYLKKDIIKATVYQHPFKQGYNSVTTLINYIYRGNVNNCNLKINSELITKYNIPDYI
ncbi:MAG: LacI family DNA-binding transcriptional regulator [Clostridia bacterium]|nr:LacI family DNA-binding transcriptional regulator [Clostridia bacterium]